MSSHLAKAPLKLVQRSLASQAVAATNAAGNNLTDAKVT